MQVTEADFRVFRGVGKLPYIRRIHTASIVEDSSILGTERNVS